MSVCISAFFFNLITNHLKEDILIRKYLRFILRSFLPHLFCVTKFIAPYLVAKNCFWKCLLFVLSINKIKRHESMSALGVNVLDMSALGVNVLGISALGVNVLGMSTLGVNVLGISALGVNVLGTMGGLSVRTVNFQTTNRFRLILLLEGPH